MKTRLVKILVMVQEEGGRFTAGTHVYVDDLSRGGSAHPRAVEAQATPNDAVVAAVQATLDLMRAHPVCTPEDVDPCGHPAPCRIVGCW